VTLPEVASCLKTAQPGDQIYIKDGQYKDMQLKWTGKERESSYQDRSLESWKSKN
jgi:poly(beta-D-mannuronate) lyase